MHMEYQSTLQYLRYLRPLPNLNKVGVSQFFLYFIKRWKEKIDLKKACLLAVGTGFSWVNLLAGSWFGASATNATIRAPHPEPS